MKNKGKKECVQKWVILWTPNIYKYTLRKPLRYLVLYSNTNKKECSYAYHKIQITRKFCSNYTPSDNGKKPSENQEYIVVYSEDGTITLVPKIEDPFSGGEEAEYYEKDDWGDVTPEGREIL